MPSSHRTRKHICMWICMKILDLACMLCEHSHLQQCAPVLHEVSQKQFMTLTHRFPIWPQNVKKFLVKTTWRPPIVFLPGISKLKFTFNLHVCRQCSRSRTQVCGTSSAPRGRRWRDRTAWWFRLPPLCGSSCHSDEAALEHGIGVNKLKRNFPSSFMVQFSFSETVNSIQDLMQKPQFVAKLKRFQRYFCARYRANPRRHVPVWAHELPRKCVANRPQKPRYEMTSR